MKKILLRTRLLSALALCLAGSIGLAHAATGDAGTVTLTPNADETAMELKWVFPDDFGPIGECNASFTFSISAAIDNKTVVGPFNNGNYTLTRDDSAGGNCVLKKTIVSGAVYTNKVSPGVWVATATISGYNPLQEVRTIYACTATQGKQPMYWTRNAAYTDNFYTTSTSQRDTSLSIGYSNRGVPFAMPNQVRFGSKPFYRYFKGAPQFEHFYTYMTNEWRFVEQNGYTYEGIEGYVFETRKPGSVPLYRFNLFNPSNSDLQHLYSINRNDPNAAGMAFEGIVGYVCAP
jgi:Repeat of unknown function (DUF5648)